MPGENQLIRQPLIVPNLSLPRRRESSNVKNLWIPAFAGITFLEVAINLIDSYRFLLDIGFKKIQKVTFFVVKNYKKLISLQKRWENFFKRE